MMEASTEKACASCSMLGSGLPALLLLGGGGARGQVFGAVKVAAIKGEERMEMLGKPGAHVVRIK